MANNPFDPPIIQVKKTLERGGMAGANKGFGSVRSSSPSSRPAPGPQTIDELDDVDTTDLENGNVLVWNEAEGLWLPGEGGGGGGGAGSGFGIVDYTESNAQLTLSASGTIWTRTIAAAPAGTYLVMGRYWAWASSGYGTITIRKGGVQQGGTSDPGREAMPAERQVRQLVEHTGGDLVLDLYFAREAGTIQFGASGDARFGRSVHIIGPIAGGTVAGGDTAWREVGKTGQPAYESGWVPYNTDGTGDLYHGAGFRKDAAGIVHLRGLVKSGTINSPIFTLPVGYRPGTSPGGNNHHLFPVLSAPGYGRLDLRPDGQVKPLSPSTNAWVSLDGLTFFAEA